MHGAFGYRSKLGKYEHVDEDELLATLSAEELRELERELVDLEPDDAVPVGHRQQDHTSPASTSAGSFSTGALPNYWDNNNHQLRQDKVTFLKVSLPFIEILWHCGPHSLTLCLCCFLDLINISTPLILFTYDVVSEPIKNPKMRLIFMTFS